MVEIELKPGVETSEHAHTRLVVLVGALISVAGIVLETLSQLGIGASWLGLATIVLGVLTKLAATFGYVKSRTELKAEVINATAKTAEVEAQLIKDAPDALRAINRQLSMMNDLQVAHDLAGLK